MLLRLEALILLSCYLGCLLIASRSPSLKVVAMSSSNGNIQRRDYQHHHHHHHHNHRHRRHHQRHHCHRHGHQEHSAATDDEAAATAAATTTDGPRHLRAATTALAESSWPATFDMIAPGKRRHVATTSGSAQETGASKGLVVERKKGRSRRELVALNLAVNRLRILESLDEQLVAFASDLAQRRQRQQQSAVTHCRLPMDFLANKSETEEQYNSREDYPQEEQTEEQEEEEEEEEESLSCLSSDHLRRQIPAYMLNLHTKLSAEAHTLEEAVRLMPYKSVHKMRSFRQPPIHLPSPKHHHHSTTTTTTATAQAAEPLASNNHDNDDDDNMMAFRSLVDDSELVVELDVTQSPASSSRRKAAVERRRRRRQRRYTTRTAGVTDSGRGAPPFEQAPSLPPPTSSGTGKGSSSPWAQQWQQEQTSGCDLGERLRPARDRTQLCYWFRLNRPAKTATATESTINGSLGSQLIGSLIDTRAEQLIEAELHLFKLKPDPELLKRHQDDTKVNSSSSSELQTNEFRLRTNLLEVSLYQILPVKSGQSENPLRLLDIRRIDLDSSGWESFYVKRAVQDWLSDPSSNLGLVIKAKSMFDEPIRIGLIRFADLYDHRWPPAADWIKSHLADHQTGTGNGGGGISKGAIEFDVSHQPALVVYTAAARDLESNG